MTYLEWSIASDEIPYPYIAHFCEAIYTLMNKMWWGIVLGVFFVGLIGLIPRDLVIYLLGQKNGTCGLLRAVFLGVLLDLCSHGILLIAMKLYERGARLGQVMAFLIASPWNSLSLTVILVALIGLWWTLAFIFISAVIAIISGLIFDHLVQAKKLPQNLHHKSLPKDFSPKQSFIDHIKELKKSNLSFLKYIAATIVESKMILRWIFFGVVLAATLRTAIPADIYKTYLGPTIIGLFLTTIAAIIIEVCSEGTVPVASDLLTYAGAPGNSFAFLMSGVATDYTEIMALKETTKSWKIAFMLPAVVVPQVLLVSYIINISAT